MKKLSEILKLPVMEILNGQIAGKVKDVVMNPDTKEVLLVMDEGVFSDFHILQKPDVIGIGADFIMVKTKQAIQSSRENSELAKVLTEYYSIIGLTVIMTSGNIVSKIEDFTIDEQSWQLIEVILDNGESYSRNQLVSVSEKFVFVQADTVPEVEEASEEAVISEEEAYLVGMTLTADIISEDGNYLLEGGTVLTKETIAEAKENGVLADLIMNVE